MRNHRIAYFTADWNYELVETTLHGLKRYVDDHENVQLCIFDCFGKDHASAEDRSEYAIFDLPDLTRFDGVLVQGNQIVDEAVRDRISQRILKTGIPAVSIDCPLPGCVLVGIDNEKAQHDITAHLIAEHGARRLAYLTGILDNGCPEAINRRNGFLNACHEAGIPDEDISMFGCTWRNSDGIDVAQACVSSGRPLPDAFVCANDDMALGVIEGLKSAGLRVPEDVMVTGFDNLSSAELSSPRLSTVHRDYVRMDYLAMEVLIRRIEGQENRDFVPFDYEIVCSESCGCSQNSRPSYIRDQYFRQIQFLKHFYMLQHAMSESLVAASTLMEIMDILENNHEIFGCKNIYLCINDYYYDNYEKSQWQHDSESFGDNMILATCERDTFVADEHHLYARFPTPQLLPEALMNLERFLVFYPLHYNTYSIGYLVMDDISEAAKMNLHESIIRFLEISIENVRKKGLLHQLNATLDNLYVHDALTGLYNRFGLERYGCDAFESFLAEGGAQILFIDMDDMKGINDRFGHEAGDEAIRITADILRESLFEPDFAMRYGGDEFLVIAPGGEAGLEEAILACVERRAARAETPYTVHLSIGTIRVDASDPRSLEECVQAADAQMYAIKAARRAARG